MKHLILALCVAVATTCHSQSAYTEELLTTIKGQYTVDDHGNLTYAEVVEDTTLTKEQLFLRARAYFVYAYASANDVIQMEDKEAGVIAGKGIYKDVYTGHPFMTTITCHAWHVLRIDVKDGRYRILLTLTDYDKDLYDGNGRFTSTFHSKVSSEYPIDPAGKSKTVMGKTFFYVHERAQKTMAALKVAMKEGTTVTESGGW